MKHNSESKKDNVSALELYTKAIELEPSNSEAWAGKADFLRKLDRDDEAVTAYNNAMNLYKQSDCHNDALKCYNKIIKIKGAIAIHLDDSSDEEGIELPDENELKSVLFDENIKGEKQLSIISHILGTSLLYSPKVQLRYIKLKEEKLCNDGYSEVLINKFKEWLCHEFLSLIKQKFFYYNKPLYTTIYNDFISKSKGDLQDIISQAIKNHERDLFKAFGKGRVELHIGHHLDENPIVSKICFGFEKILKAYIDVLPENQIIQNYLAETDLSQNIKINKEIQDHVWILATDLMKKERVDFDKMSTINKNLSFSTKSEEYCKSIMEEKPILGKVLKDSYDACKESRTKIDCFKHKVTNALYQNILNDISQNTDQLECKKALETSMKKTIQQAISGQGIQAIQKELAPIECKITSLKDNFINHLVKSYGGFFLEQGLSRKTLKYVETFDLSNILEEDFFVDFLAHLRLCNRSAKRDIKNREDIDAKYPGENSYYTLQEKIVSWKFPSTEELIIDKQGITKGDGIEKEYKRMDKTANISSYENFCDFLEHLKLKMCVNAESKNQVISDCIKNIIKGNKIDYLKSKLQIENPFISEKMVGELTKFAYLLFGSEVVRNPATLVHNCMILDFLAKPNSDAKNIIGKMPMADENAVSYARALNKIYYEIMPYNCSYRYDQFLKANSETKAGKLIAKEYEIMKSWLTQVMAKQEEEYFDGAGHKFLKEDSYKSVTNIFIGKCGEFYDFGIAEY